jgi:hypothetical protein
MLKDDRGRLQPRRGLAMPRVMVTRPILAVDIRHLGLRGTVTKQPNSCGLLMI